MSLTLDLNKFNKGTVEDLGLIWRGSLLSLGKSVIMDTPVDKGPLRGGWQSNVGSPKTQDINRIDKTGTIAIKELVDNLPDIGEDFYFTNAVPYAIPIEFDGVSHTKAPEGMMTKNVVRYTRLVKEEARKRR